MAIKLNQVRIAGNLGADPEGRTLQNGDLVANFSVAVTETWKDKSGERKDKTEWVRVFAFGQPAEFVTTYGKKGDNVYVEGKLESRSFEDKDGQKRTVTEVRASGIQLASAQRDAAQGRADHQATLEDRNSGNAGSTTIQRSRSDRPGGGSYQDRRQRAPAFA